MNDPKAEAWKRKSEYTYKVIVAMAGLLATISIGVTGWTVSQIMRCHEHLKQHEIRITKIEANRFTAKDGYELIKVIEQKYPPPWLVQKVDKNEARLDKLLGKP